MTAQYAPTVLQTISNPDGTVSIIQVDPNNPIITLPDGTTAQVQGVATVSEVSVQLLVVFMFTSLDRIELHWVWSTENKLARTQCTEVPCWIQYAVTGLHKSGTASRITHV